MTASWALRQIPRQGARGPHRRAQHDPAWQVVFIGSTAEGQEGLFFELGEAAGRRSGGVPLTPLDFKFLFSRGGNRQITSWTRQALKSPTRTTGTSEVRDAAGGHASGIPLNARRGLRSLGERLLRRRVRQRRAAAHPPASSAQIRSLRVGGGAANPLISQGKARELEHAIGARCIGRDVMCRNPMR